MGAVGSGAAKIDAAAKLWHTPELAVDAILTAIEAKPTTGSAR